MKTTIIVLSLFLSIGVVAQTNKLYLHDFPTQEKTIEITYTSTDECIKEIIAKEVLFILIKTPNITSNVLTTQLAQKVESLKIDKLIFKPEN